MCVLRRGLSANCRRTAGWRRATISERPFYPRRACHANYHRDQHWHLPDDDLCRRRRVWTNAHIRRGPFHTAGFRRANQRITEKRRMVPPDYSRLRPHWTDSYRDEFLRPVDDWAIGRKALW